MVAKSVQHVAPNSVAICRVQMLWSFGRSQQMLGQLCRDMLCWNVAIAWPELKNTFSFFCVFVLVCVRACVRACLHGRVWSWVRVHFFVSYFVQYSFIRVLFFLPTTCWSALQKFACLHYTSNKHPLTAILKRTRSLYLYLVVCRQKQSCWFGQSLVRKQRSRGETSRTGTKGQFATRGRALSLWKRHWWKHHPCWGSACVDYRWVRLC